MLTDDNYNSYQDHKCWYDWPEWGEGLDCYKFPDICVQKRVFTQAIFLKCLCLLFVFQNKFKEFTEASWPAIECNFLNLMLWYR